MAWCDLSIELDEPAGEFRQGDAITGQVCVRVRQPGHCNGLVLAYVWFTRSTGSREEKRVGRKIVHAGAWSPGEYRYRFSLSAPRGPLSYDGESLAIAWRLEASAELAWSRDARASVEFRLGPRLDADINEPYDFGPNYTVPIVTRERPSWLPRVFGLMVFAQLAYLAPTLVLVASPLLAAPLLYARWRRSRLGAPELRVVPRTTCPGETIDVTFALDVPRDLHIDAVMVALNGVVCVRTGRDFTGHVIHTQVSPLGPADRTVRAGERVSESTSFSLPSDAPYTFEGFHSAIVWHVIVSVRIRERIAWSEVCMLEVRPGRPRGGVYRRPAM